MSAASDIKIYEPVAEVQNIIGILVENIYHDDTYQAYLSNLESSSETAQKKANIIKKTFTDIRVFNNNTEPLFLARDMGILMGITGINSTIKNYNESEKIVGYVMHNNKPRKKYFLTRYGVYRILFNSRTKLSEVFRGFIYKLLDHMFQYELDKLRTIINQYTLENPDLVEESVMELYENVNKFKQMYEIEKNERTIWMHKAEEEYEKNAILEHEKTEAELQNNYSEMFINQLQSDKRVYLNKIYSIKDEIAPVFDEDKEVLNILKQKFLKEINIFIATPQHVGKLFAKRLKNTSEESIEENLYDIENYKKEYEYVIGDFKRDPLLISDKDLYYYITFKNTKADTDKYIHIYTEWVLDRLKFKELITVLKSECETIQIGGAKKEETFLFKTTLDNIKSITYDILIS